MTLVYRQNNVEILGSLAPFWALYNHIAQQDPTVMLKILFAINKDGPIFASRFAAENRVTRASCSHNTIQIPSGSTLVTSDPERAPQQGAESQEYVADAFDPFEAAQDPSMSIRDTLRQLFSRRARARPANPIPAPRPPVQEDPIAAVPPAPAVLAPQERPSATANWITLEAWLRRVEASREWEWSDMTAHLQWDAVAVTLVRRYTALQDDKLGQGLVWESWRTEDLLVRGDLDLDHTWKEIYGATTMEVKMLGRWIPQDPIDLADDKAERDERLMNLIQDDLIWKYFPQYSSF